MKTKTWNAGEKTFFLESGNYVQQQQFKADYHGLSILFVNCGPYCWTLSGWELGLYSVKHVHQRINSYLKERAEADDKYKKKWNFSYKSGENGLALTVCTDQYSAV